MEGTSLKDRTVVVLGASAGIGRAIAIRAAREGGNVVMVARRKDLLDQVRQEAGSGEVVVGDVASPEDCQRIASEASELIGPIDVVVSSIGTAPMRRISETTYDDWMMTLGT